jgi:hypothetical protein
VGAGFHGSAGCCGVVGMGKLAQGGNLGERGGQHSEVIGGGERAGVARATHHRQRIADIATPTGQRVETEPALIRTRRLGLGAGGLDQGGIQRMTSTGRRPAPGSVAGRVRSLPATFTAGNCPCRATICAHALTRPTTARALALGSRMARTVEQHSSAPHTHHLRPRNPARPPHRLDRTGEAGQTSKPPTPLGGQLITDPDDPPSKINTEARPRIQA